MKALYEKAGVRTARWHLVSQREAGLAFVCLLYTSTPLDYLSQLEGISEPSAFYCERPVFAKLVQSKRLEARRSAEPIVLLITHLKVLDAELSAQACGDLMNRIIRSGLRANDVYTRFSKTQFGILITVSYTHLLY